jgi:hypothetical protein
MIYQIQCRCGHADEFECFCRTEIGGELPKGQFQCPECGEAWAVRSKGAPTMTPSGFVIPAKREIVAVQGRL